MPTVGVDQSKKSTAVVALDSDGDMIDFCLINPPMGLDKEDLILYQWNGVNTFLIKNGVGRLALEAAAFAAMGNSNDMLWGIQWYIRTRLLVEYPEVPVGILTAATWRSSILTTEEQRVFKAQYGGKIGLKHAVISKLPEYIKDEFLDYLECNRDYINVHTKGMDTGSRSKRYLECLFDLADAWGIATHRHKLIAGIKKPSKSKKIESFVPKILKRR